MSIASLSRDVCDGGPTFSKTVWSIKKREPGLCLQMFGVKAEGGFVFHASRMGYSRIQSLAYFSQDLDYALNL